jgi:hypothetical protein
MMLKLSGSIMAALMFLSSVSQSLAEDTAEQKAQIVKDTLVFLCMAGGSTSKLSVEGEVDLQAKIRDIISGKIGATVGGKTSFTKETWEGIVGGYSKDMTAVQSAQIDEARKCMIEHGYELLKKILNL